MDYLSFKLPDQFVDQYKDRPVDWGFDIGGGNFLGEITFYSKYSRLKEDGSKERWYECVRRCIEGMYSIQKNFCTQQRIPWNTNKAQHSAQEAYELMFKGVWTPPGRGLEHMGTQLIFEFGSAPLQNCSFISTENIGPRNPIEPFVLLMEMSMLGIGVGFDTKGAGKVEVYQPLDEKEIHVVEDSREGWVESYGALLRSYFYPNQKTVVFDTGLIRDKGAPIKRFGGTAPGPGPLVDLHKKVRMLLDRYVGQMMDERLITDLNNLAGYCVVSGGRRRTAEIAFGDLHDEVFLNLKNWETETERMDNGTGWGHISNNSVFAKIGDDLSHLVEPIKLNGEPGIMYLDLAQAYGRLGEAPDYKDNLVAGANPCVEQQLESYECCVTADTLIQTRSGLRRIGGLVGSEVDIWNGEQWSSVHPFSTGVLPVYRVSLSDGSYLDATPGHEWLARKKTARTFKELKTTELEVGMYLPEFEIAGIKEGKPVDMAYEIGWFAGDGYLDQDRPMMLVQESEYGVLDSMRYTALYPEQTNSQTTPFKRLSMAGLIELEVAKQLRDHRSGLPNVVLSMDEESIAEFMGGWIDTDGSVIRQEDTHHYVLYGDEQKLRDAQILLRRIGINHATIREFAPAGQVTNKGVRNQALYRLLIPSYEAMGIRTRLKIAVKFGSRYGVNNRHPASQIDRARKQKIVSIEKISDGAETYCFNEPKLHRGVFANVLTKQCTLVETFPFRAEDFNEYKRALKYAYLYAKTVTLLPTHWPKVNEIMQRNRRIGTSMTGVFEFAEVHGWNTLRNWCNDGVEVVNYYDNTYSRWLGIRESIRNCSIKPSGTTSLLWGATPGQHAPVASGAFLRLVRAAVGSSELQFAQDAGYFTEPDVKDPENTWVIYYPVQGQDVRSEREVPLFEQMALAALLQRHWADNMVSATFKFKPEEEDQIASALRAFEGQLKCMSFLPLGPELSAGAYPQMPYQDIDEDTWNGYRAPVIPIDWDKWYSQGVDAQGDKFCNNDVCTI